MKKIRLDITETVNYTTTVEVPDDWPNDWTGDQLKDEALHDAAENLWLEYGNPMADTVDIPERSVDGWSVISINRQGPQR